MADETTDASGSQTADAGSAGRGETDGSATAANGRKGRKGRKGNGHKGAERGKGWGSLEWRKRKGWIARWTVGGERFTKSLGKIAKDKAQEKLADLTA